MQPRYYQQDAHDAAWNYLSSQPGEPLIVLPTGAGKSLVIAMLVEQARKFNARVIVLQHRKELIEQNAEKIQVLLPGIKVGKNSAGLRRHSFDDDVICAGIQSVFKKAHDFGRRELIIIDEVHLVNGSDDSMYGKFLSDIQAINPRARMVGLTATPFRTGEGPICGSNKLFQRICYESSTGDLIREGFLCPITNKTAEKTVDTSKIKSRGGEFISGEMEKAFDSGDKVSLACGEIVDKCHDRESILVFSAGVDHAEHVKAQLEDFTGDRVGIVTGETFSMERVKTLQDFRDGNLRWLVNCDVLTTGFDAPCIDAIAILRATMSPGLFAQIVGRGLRKHESKSECLILDFGGNIARHGSIDDPNYGRASQGTNSSSTVDNNGRGKLCLNCENEIQASCKTCPECGFIFPDEPQDRHGETADEESTLTGVPDPEAWDVIGCSWSSHTKRNAPENAPKTLRVDYRVRPVEVSEVEHECKYNCGGTFGRVRKNGPHIELLCATCKKHQQFVSKEDAPKAGNLTEKHVSEWVCFEHEGFARGKAIKWWQDRSEFTVPETIEEAVSFLDCNVARVPSTVTTQVDGKFTRIISVEFIDDIPEESEWLVPDEVTVGGSFLRDSFIDEDEVPF